MEVSQGSTHKLGFSGWWPTPTTSLSNLKSKAIGVSKKVKKIGEDDPRRIVHSLKVGLALTLVSIFYDVTPLYIGFGVSAMWAVLTVVVVMEYTVGGTISKGLNRAFATLVAGALGIGAHQIAVLTGEMGEPIVLGLFVFLLAAAATYSRFIPEIKARYDYGVIVFTLTFSLVAVSSYRVDELTQLAQQRLSTIAIGVAICLLTSILVFPVWAGEDLHNLVAANLEKLASFLEGLRAEHFGEKGGGEEGISFLQGYKSVLNSKPTEESLANFARWEPCHGRFGFRHPWKRYLKIGALCRQCAYSMEALCTHMIPTSRKTQTIACPFDVQAPTEPPVRGKILSACLEMSVESGKALMELAAAIRTMTTPSATANPHTATATAATIKLKDCLSEEAGAISEVLDSAIAASLLIEIVQCVQQITDSVAELARLGHFKISSEAIHRATVKPLADREGPHVAMDVED